MGIYEDLGLRPVINAAGAATRLGGPRVIPAVADAMLEASGQCVPIDELQAVASSTIAGLLGAEAGLVTAGAAAGLTLATAACLAGFDLNRIEALPDTRGMPGEVVVCREQRNGYDHAIRAAGAVLIEVGMNELGAGAGSRRTEAWEIERAINDQTAAIAYFATPSSEPALEEVVEVARRREIPLIVDAAGQLPPVSNLRRYGSCGADAVVFSGGKAIRGPQGTGILAGSRHLVMSAALQSLDFDEWPATWNPPTSLIDRSLFAGLPRHGIGRGFKVSKEEIVGLLVALQAFAADGHEEATTDYRRHVDRVFQALKAINSNVRVLEPDETDGIPTVEVRIDEGSSGRSAVEVVQQLKAGSPAVYVGEHRLRQHTIVIHPIALNDDDVEELISKLVELLQR